MSQSESSTESINTLIPFHYVDVMEIIQNDKDRDHGLETKLLMSVIREEVKIMIQL